MILRSPAAYQQSASGKGAGTSCCYFWLQLRSREVYGYLHGVLEWGAIAQGRPVQPWASVTQLRSSPNRRVQGSEGSPGCVHLHQEPYKHKLCSQLNPASTGCPARNASSLTCSGPDKDCSLVTMTPRDQTSARGSWMDNSGSSAVDDPSVGLAALSPEYIPKGKAKCKAT